MIIALGQMEVKQTAFDENIQAALGLAKQAKNAGAQMIVFPEMFVGGFHYPENKLALESGRDFAHETAEMANQAGIFVAGSVPAVTGKSGLPANRMVLANPDGKIEMTYDKIHLFGVFSENKYVHGGERLAVDDTPLGRIGMAVCYDLRFPEMFVQMAVRDTRMLILSAAWPHPRMNHFRTLVRARAIEMQSFVVAVNQAGLEDFGTKQICYGGESCVIDPWGETVCECKKDKPDFLVCEINFNEVDNARNRIPALSDRRPHFYR